MAKLDGGARRVVIDLAGVDYISSAGLRAAGGRQAALAAAGNVRAGALGPSVRTVLELAGFMSLFAVEPARRRSRERPGGSAP
jgi:anti-anti-sigma factor